MHMHGPVLGFKNEFEDFDSDNYYALIYGGNFNCGHTHTVDLDIFKI